MKQLGRRGVFVFLPQTAQQAVSGLELFAGEDVYRPFHFLTQLRGAHGRQYNRGAAETAPLPAYTFRSWLRPILSRPSSPASRRHPPVTSTSAGRGRRCSVGSSLATTAGGSCFASRTRTWHAPPSRRLSSCSKTSAGSGCTGTMQSS